MQSSDLLFERDVVCGGDDKLRDNDEYAVYSSPGRSGGGGSSLPVSHCPSAPASPQQLRASHSSPALVPPQPLPHSPRETPPSSALRVRLDPLASYEIAHSDDEPRNVTTSVMTPSESDELAELRTMLPRFRRMRMQAEGAAAGYFGGAGTAAAGAGNWGEMERAPSPPLVRSRHRGGRRSNPDSPPGSPGGRRRGSRASRGSRRSAGRGRSADAAGSLRDVLATGVADRSASAKNMASAVVLGVDGGGGGGGESSSDSESDLSIVSSQTPYVKLSRDVYSLLYFTLPLSVGFFFAIGIFIFQMLILVLIMVDTVDGANKDNELRIPAGVSVVVRISQALAILVAIATQDDLITSLNAMHTGYDGKLEQRKGVGGHYWQWVISVSGRFLEGSMCLVVTFILIVQTKEVVDLFIDFLAVTFVSTLDNVAFALARDGYFSQRLHRETYEVSMVRVPRSNKALSLFRPLAFFVVSASMLLGFGFVCYKQGTGQYLSCSRITVQFGDSFLTTLAFFSSIYEVYGYDAHKRPIYVERGPDGEVGGLYGHAKFAYCDEEKAWTFSFSGASRNVVQSESFWDIDPCQWYAKSSETNEWDIMAIEHNEWYVYGNESKSAKPFQHFSIRCVDCDDSDRGACSEVGTCSGNVCSCGEGRYGLNCEFKEPCYHLAVDTSRGGFPGQEEWSKDFQILYHRDIVKKAKAYERPIYTNEYENGMHHVIMFTGRRWILADSTALTDSHQTLSHWELADYLTYSFHAYWSTYDARYISSPADVVTPTDSATPIGLDWFQTKSYNMGADKNFPISTLLLCTLCDIDSNPCLNGGECSADGLCSCRYGTFGSLCQVNSFVLCRSISVSFGDELVSTLPSLGGAYDLSNRNVAGRSVYVARRRGGAMFAYCDDEGAWTLTLLPPGSGRSFLDADPCSNWKAMSAKTETYDITTLVTGWSVRRALSVDVGVPLTFFQMSCVDCDRNKKRTPCSGAGRCVDHGCICDEDKFGLACNLREPCLKLEMDSSVEFKWPAEYNLFNDDRKDVKLYDRPVYISEEVDSSYFLIVFTGRRWVISRLETDTNAIVSSKIELTRYLREEFHGYYSNYTVELISEAVQADTNMDIASPVDLSWFLPKLFDNKRPDLQAPVKSSPRCAFCDHLDHPCYNKGACADGVCSCPVGTFGTLCQVDSVCTSLSLEFGSSLTPPMPSLSGAYNINGGGGQNVEGGRPFYISEAGNAMLAYCRKDAIWTFKHLEEGGAKNLSDPCSEWTARSAPSYTYDIIETSKWQIRHNDSSVVGMSRAIFSYACNDQRRKTREYSP